MHNVMSMRRAKLLNQFTHPATTFKSGLFPEAYKQCTTVASCTVLVEQIFTLRRELRLRKTPFFRQDAPSPSAGVGPPRRPHVIRLSLRRRAGLRRGALRTLRHDVVRRGWLAAILLLFLARSLPFGKQRKCFGGLSIHSFGLPSRVVLAAAPSPSPSLPHPSIRARRRLSKCADTPLDTRPGG